MKRIVVIQKGKVVASRTRHLRPARSSCESGQDSVPESGQDTVPQGYLFGAYENNLGAAAADKILAGGRVLLDGDNFEVLLSLKTRAMFDALGADVGARLDTMKTIVRDGIRGVQNDRGIYTHRWVASIHLDTTYPHVHIIVPTRMYEIATDASVVKTGFPMRWYVSREGAPSRVAAHFEVAYDAVVTSSNFQALTAG